MIPDDRGETRQRIAIKGKADRRFVTDDFGAVNIMISHRHSCPRFYDNLAGLDHLRLPGN